VAKLSQASAAAGPYKLGSGGASTGPSGVSSDPLVQQVAADIDNAQLYQSAKLYEQADMYKQMAIDDAIDAYSIDTSAAHGVLLDPTLRTANGYTDPHTGIVHIGPSAFGDPSYLGSTIGHEAEVHAVQLFGNNLSRTAKGLYVNEAQAYQYEVDNASRYGTAYMALRSLQNQVVHFEGLASSMGYGDQIANRTYTVDKSDLYSFER
jgi:hypothetical protein